MNQLEKAVIDGAKSAQKRYEKMTGGWWLGPESFIQYCIAFNVSERGFLVIPEASPKKIMEERNAPPKGRPPKNIYQRFDLVVWQNRGNDIKAIIEIKRAWSINDLIRDRDKIATFLKRNEYVKSGYLLAYTTTDGDKRETLSKRIHDFAEKLNCKLVDPNIESQSDGEWSWAFGLFRLP